jgi:hypothetical protein
MSPSEAPSAGRLGTGEEEQSKNDQNTRCQDLLELFTMRYSTIGDEESPERRDKRRKQERCCRRQILKDVRSWRTEGVATQLESRWRPRLTPDQSTRCQDLSELFAMRYSKLGGEEIPVRRANRGKQERCCLRLTLRMRRSGE